MSLLPIVSGFGEKTNLLCIICGLLKVLIANTHCILRLEIRTFDFVGAEGSAFVIPLGRMASGPSMCRRYVPWLLLTSGNLNLIAEQNGANHKWSDARCEPSRTVQCKATQPDGSGLAALEWEKKGTLGSRREDLFPRSSLPTPQSISQTGWDFGGITDGAVRRLLNCTHLRCFLKAPKTFWRLIREVDEGESRGVHVIPWFCWTAWPSPPFHAHCCCISPPSMMSSFGFTNASRR